jgi:hypothetical protein
MAANTFYHFDSEVYSDLLYKIFSDRDISDTAINKLLVEVENTTNNVLSFEEEISSDYESIDCLSERDNQIINDLLSNPFLDVYFVHNFQHDNFSLNEASFHLVEKSNNGFSVLKDESLGNTAIFVVDSRELAPLFSNLEEYMFGTYSVENGIEKNLNYKSRHEFDGKDISYESYFGEYSLPVVSDNILINELYKKLYSLEVLFGKYVDEKGFEDIKNQIRYYASAVVNLKNSISEEMVMDEARLSENYNEEFAL